MIDEPEEAREALDLIREVGGDELVQTLLRSFLGYADGQMALAANAAAAANAMEIARAAHAIKSSASQLGAHALAAACERAELAGANGRDSAGAIAGFAEMQGQLAATRPWMEAVARGS